MMESFNEPRKQRLKRKWQDWPIWLRLKYLIRWLSFGWPFAYQLYKMALAIFSGDGG